MGEIKLTKAQQAVVENRGGALLVSAAAGSGKTKVLVDRLLSKICDKERPCDIDDFLVITYTNAAAAELRLKIAQALSSRLAEEPENRHLQRQMNRIYLAEISTVHAFCANLIRSYAHILDIPGDFRMIEEMEAQVLQKKVLDALLEQGYEELSDDFKAMVETFGYGRDDRRLPEAVLMANRAMRCRADMKQWVEETLNVLDLEQYTDVMQTPWGKYVMAEFHAFLEQQIRRLQDARSEMMRYPSIESKYGPVFAQNIDQLKTLRAVETWDEIIDHQIEDFGRLSVVRDPEDLAVKERMKNLRNKCWSDLQKWQTMFYAKSDALLDDLRQVMPGAQALIRFSQKFDKAYGAEKKRRKFLDFSDLEHLAIRLLTDKYTGKPTAIAAEVAKRYEEIMVDEYQDSNQVQEVIFQAVSKDGNNRFMVGDVKQSIYRFRLADPTLFLQKYEAYPDYEQAQMGEPRRILLSENFRSRKEILSACNDVFRLIMRKQVGDLDYGEEEALRPGREFPKLSQIPVELHCLTSTQTDKTVDKRDLEAEFVAGRIRNMLDEKMLVTDKDGAGLRPVTPGDIVILMRAVSSNAQAYLQALERVGVPAVCNRGGSLLDTTEIQTLTAMLKIIDNPHQDVPLLTVLAGPVFGFSAEELAQVRTHSRKEDFFTAMHDLGGKYRQFIDTLNALREDAMWLPLHALVDKVLSETNMLSVFAAMPDGVQREKNLRAFSGFVASFEANGSRALSQLLWYLTNLQESGGQLPVSQDAAEDAVNIMTVHKSKGLEFPVVFLCDLSHKFNTSDMQDAILVDDVLAVGCNHIDNTRFVRYPTLAKKSIEWKKRKESVSEELRVLYVAMTRPKDMLVMTYYSKYLYNELSALNSQLTMPLSDDLCAGVNNPGKWLLLAALCRTEAGELLNLVGGNEVSSVSANPWLIKFHDLSADTHEIEKQPAIPQQIQATDDSALIACLQYSYPHREICDAPIKLTATQLKGRIQDQEAAEGAVGFGATSSYSFRKASFLTREMTPSEKGVANHLFMQFAVFENCTSEHGIKQELERMAREKFLTAEQCAAVRGDKIMNLFQSDLGRWLLSVPELKREFKFSLLVDAQDYLPQAVGENMLLQGVVDCFAIESDGITVVDFKTDRVGNAAEVRAEVYKSQIEAYAKALSSIYQMPVKKKILYFFDGDCAVAM